MIQFEIPYIPPSANELFANKPKKKLPNGKIIGGGRMKTGKYEDWLHHAGWSILTQRIRPVSGPCTIRIELSTRSGMDLSNCVKPVEDLLVKQRIIEDDRKQFVRGHETAWADIEGIRVTLTLAEQKKEVA